MLVRLSAYIVQSSIFLQLLSMLGFYNPTVRDFPTTSILAAVADGEFNKSGVSICLNNLRVFAIGAMGSKSELCCRFCYQWYCTDEFLFF